MRETLGVFTIIALAVVALAILSHPISMFMSMFDDAYDKDSYDSKSVSRAVRFFQKIAKFAARQKVRHGERLVRIVGLLSLIPVLVFGAWLYSDRGSSMIVAVLDTAGMVFWTIVIFVRPFIWQTGYDIETRKDDTNDNDTEHNTLTHNR